MRRSENVKKYQETRLRDKILVDWYTGFIEWYEENFQLMTEDEMISRLGNFVNQMREQQVEDEKIINTLNAFFDYVRRHNAKQNHLTIINDFMNSAFSEFEYRKR